MPNLDPSEYTADRVIIRIQKELLQHISTLEFFMEKLKGNQRLSDRNIETAKNIKEYLISLMNQYNSLIKQHSDKQDTASTDSSPAKAIRGIMTHTHFGMPAMRRQNNALKTTKECIQFAIVALNKLRHVDWRPQKHILASALHNDT